MKYFRNIQKCERIPRCSQTLNSRIVLSDSKKMNKINEGGYDDYGC